MKQLRLLGALLGGVARDLMRHRGQHFLAVVTLSSGLIVAGGGLLAVETLNRWVGHMESMAKITLFAAENASLNETETMLKRDPRFQSVQRVTSQEGTRRFQEVTRDAGLMLQSLGREPIPESLELTLRPDLFATHKALEVGQSLQSLPGVGDVLVDQERLETLARSGRMLRSALATLGFILLLAAAFSTGNVIRMTVLAREEEIGIMRLVGATESYIRTPLLLEGACLGFFASTVAITFLFCLWLPLNRGMGHVSPLLVEMARLGFFSIQSLVILGLLGMGTGALGALWGFWSTQRAQRKVEAMMEEEQA